MLAAGLLLAATLPAEDRKADTQRLIGLLTGVRIAYLEGFEDGEELVAIEEVEEARVLLAEARGLNDRLKILPPDALAAIARDLDSPVGSIEVPGRIAALVADVSTRTGITMATAPPARPSAARGRNLYRDNCTGCHGDRGRGDGPDATRLGIKPADFTNVLFMRRETPKDFFIMVTLGHRRRGMPEWSALSVQERWDLVAHVWGLATSDAERADGARVWTGRCAGCHGAAGRGVSGKAADLTRQESVVERTDRMLFVGLFRGPHASATTGLTDDERWHAVGHARALSLGGGAR